MTGNVCYLVSDIMESVLVADDGFFQSRPYGSHFDHCKTLQLFKQSREHTCKNTSLSLHAKAFLLPSFLRRGQRGNHFRIYIAWTRFLFRRIPLCPGHGAIRQVSGRQLRNGAGPQRKSTERGCVPGPRRGHPRFFIGGQDSEWIYTTSALQRAAVDG